MVVEDVKTGELLALASYPTFDPNQPGQASANWTNQAFNDVYEPGSTSKVMTAAAALEEGVVTPSDAGRRSPNRIHRAGTEFHDATTTRTEHLTFAGVLAKSSNIGTIEVGEQIDAADDVDYLTKFGLGPADRAGLPR